MLCFACFFDKNEGVKAIPSLIGHTQTISHQLENVCALSFKRTSSPIMGVKKKLCAAMWLCV